MLKQSILLRDFIPWSCKYLLLIGWWVLTWSSYCALYYNIDEISCAGLTILILYNPTCQNSCTMSSVALRELCQCSCQNIHDDVSRVILAWAYELQICHRQHELLSCIVGSAGSSITLTILGKKGKFFFFSVYVHSSNSTLMCTDRCMSFMVKICNI